MLTLFSSNTAKFASVLLGTGVPNKISLRRVPIIEPPQPSAIEVLRLMCIKLSISPVHPIWVECIIVAISLSIALGSIAYSFHIFCLGSGAFFINLNVPKGFPNSINAISATSCATS